MTNIVSEGLEDQVTYILAFILRGVIRVLSEPRLRRAAEGHSKCQAGDGSNGLGVQNLSWGSFEAQQYGTLERTAG